MTELETVLLAALRKQDAALTALSEKGDKQQAEIDQLVELVQRLSISLNGVMKSLSDVEISLSER